MITDAHVTRVLLDGLRAIGVEIEAAGRAVQVEAEREVILSAGAYQSPQILLLSGVGPADELEPGGIPGPRAAGRRRAPGPPRDWITATTAEPSLLGAEPRSVELLTPRAAGI